MRAAVEYQEFCVFIEGQPLLGRVRVSVHAVLNIHQNLSLAEIVEAHLREKLTPRHLKQGSIDASM